MKTNDEKVPEETNTHFDHTQYCNHCTLEIVSNITIRTVHTFVLTPIRAISVWSASLLDAFTASIVFFMVGAAFFMVMFFIACSLWSVNWQWCPWRAQSRCLCLPWASFGVIEWIAQHAQQNLSQYYRLIEASNNHITTKSYIRNHGHNRALGLLLKTHSGAKHFMGDKKQTNEASSKDKTCQPDWVAKLQQPIFIVHPTCRPLISSSRI